jgi:hypothetical protein
METVDFVKKLENILSFYQLTASAFADKIGFQRSSMSHLLAGRNKPSLDFVMKISTTFSEVDINWFLFDIGTFPKSNQESASLNDERLKQNNDELVLTNVKLRQELEDVLIKLNQLEARATLFSAADGQLDDENKALKAKITDLTMQLSALEVQKSTFDSSLNSQSLIALEEDNHLLKSQILDLKTALLDMKNVHAEFEKTKNDLELTKKKNEELLRLNEQAKIEIAEFQENIQLKSIELENYSVNNGQLATEKEILAGQINDLTTKVSDLETYQADILAKNEELQLEINHEKAPESEATQALDDNNLKSDIESVMLLLSNGRFKEYRR